MRDMRAKARIVERLVRLEIGDFGDCKRFDGIGELRIFTGKGYRVYFLEYEDTIIVLLNGGNKDTQARDISQAKTLAKEWKDEHASD